LVEHVLQVNCRRTQTEKLADVTPLLASSSTPCSSAEEPEMAGYPSIRGFAARVPLRVGGSVWTPPFRRSTGLRLDVHLASTVFIALTLLGRLIPAISTEGNPAVSPLPKRHGTGYVQKRCQQPERGEAAGKIANSSGATMAAIAAVNDIHLIHQLLVAQIRKSFRNPRIVKGNEGEAVAAVQSGQALDLPIAKLAVTVIDDDIGTGSLSGVRQGAVHQIESG
jgi:hypothetical protein